jgi:hypothetical protein
LQMKKTGDRPGGGASRGRQAAAAGRPCPYRSAPQASMHVAARQRRHVSPRAPWTAISATCGAWRTPSPQRGSEPAPRSDAQAVGAGDARHAGPSACMPLCGSRRPLPTCEAPRTSSR